MSMSIGMRRVSVRLHELIITMDTTSNSFSSEADIMAVLTHAISIACVGCGVDARFREADW